MKFIQLIQSICSQLIQTLITCVRIVVLSRCFTKFPKNKTTENCIILGNGPSLNASLQTHADFISKHDLFAVNYFGSSELFETLKPRYYVILAPEIWAENPMESVRTTRDALFEKLAKTDWDMFFYIPHLAKKSSFWKPFFEKHAHITIVYFNPTPIDGFSFTNHFFFSRNLGMPRPHNVLTPSIMFSIAQGYSNIFLLGADHSWLEQLWVADNNDVLLTQKHFYDEQTAKALPMQNYKENKTRKLHEILHKFMLAFKSYFDLKAYAESKGVTIYNATPRSFIDAFNRYTIE